MCFALIMFYVVSCTCTMYFHCSHNYYYNYGVELLYNLYIHSESTNFLSSLEGTQWLYTISQLLSTSIEVASTIHHENRPVVVHCSDGWDRTAQVIALAELFLDPYYRSFEGFRILVEREWLSFGHKFSDRCGLGVEGEQSPIFIQWLDCVYQLMKQFPTAFEFNISYLVTKNTCKP